MLVCTTWQASSVAIFARIFSWANVRGVRTASLLTCVVLWTAMIACAWAITILRNTRRRRIDYTGSLLFLQRSHLPLSVRPLCRMRLILWRKSQVSPMMCTCNPQGLLTVYSAGLITSQALIPQVFPTSRGEPSTGLASVVESCLRLLSEAPWPSSQRARPQVANLEHQLSGYWNFGVRVSDTSSLTAVTMS